jgi:dephospho-CoA kinase
VKSVRVYGLTGGIASGKSTVARLFAAQGAKVIDADLLAREVVAPGTFGVAQIAARWPEVVADGALDRKKLGAKVFGSELDRAALNAIVHPLIAQAAQKETERLAQQGEKVVLYEAALIVENKLDAKMDGLIVVSAPESVQLARLRLREGLTETEARQRLAAQLPLQEKLARATWVVDNAGELAQTQAQVARIWSEIAKGS